MLKTAPALLALCATLVAAAPAAADSIAYIKDGNVWLATPDGSRQQQVTKTGNYGYVSQADDGTMAALIGGEKIQKLSRTGEVLSEISTFVSDGPGQSGPVTQFHGPFNPEISPDGTKIAFEWFNNSYSSSYSSSCNSAGTPACYELSSRQGVGITHADRFTGFEEFGLLTGWIGPHWMSNDRLLRSNANVAINEDAVINNIGPGKGDDDMKRWFYDDNQAAGVEEVEITRDQRYAAGIAGWGSEEMRIYRVTHDPMTAPEQVLFMTWGNKENPDVVEPCIHMGDPVGGKFENLSFSPDGNKLAYEVGDGVWIMNIPNISGGCGAQPTENGLVLPGASSPHWGPADVPPASAFEPKKNDGPVGPVTPSGDQSLTLSAGSAKLRAALLRGVTVKVATDGAGRIAAAGKIGARKVASGTKTVGAAGTHSVKVKFTAAARKALKRKRSARVSVAVTFTPADGSAAKGGSAVVRLKR
jgi:hypothetical protein